MALSTEPTHPKEWNMGGVMHRRSSFSSPRYCTWLHAFSRTWQWHSTTPLGTPLVPEVWMMVASSKGLISLILSSKITSSIRIPCSISASNCQAQLLGLSGSVTTIWRSLGRRGT